MKTFISTIERSSLIAKKQKIYLLQRKKVWYEWFLMNGSNFMACTYVKKLPKQHLYKKTRAFNVDEIDT